MSSQPDLKTWSVISLQVAAHHAAAGGLFLEQVFIILHLNYEGTNVIISRSFFILSQRFQLNSKPESDSTAYKSLVRSVCSSLKSGSLSRFIQVLAVGNRSSSAPTFWMQKGGSSSCEKIDLLRSCRYTCLFLDLRGDYKYASFLLLRTTID